jgi:hypothetical protein
MKPNIDDARYIIKEINSEKKYQELKAEYVDKYIAIDTKMKQLYYPKSPTGKKESSGESIPKETLFLQYIDKKDEMQKMAKHYDDRLKLVADMKKVVYMNDDGFARDFFNHVGYTKLCNKYAITNPSKYMTDRIIRNMKELVCNHD